MEIKMKGNEKKGKGALFDGKLKALEYINKKSEKNEMIQMK
jgi:hypothetical protein